MLLTVMFQLAKTHTWAKHMMLMHGFGTLNTLVPGHNILRHLLGLSRLYMTWPWNMNTNKNFQPPVGYEMETKYSGRLFVYLGEYIIEFMQ